MEAPQKFFPVGWDELHRNAKALAWRLIDIGSWKGIVAVTRGGMVPATIVARELDMRLVETVCVVGYRENEGRARDASVEIIKPAAIEGDGTGWLIVDDLVDTGRTFEILRKKFPKAHYATVYAKPQGKPLVDTYITEVSQDTWIYFPWDIEPQFVQPIASKRKPV